MKSIGFHYIDHLADMIVEAYGKTMEEAFERSALGLVNIMFDLDHITINQNISLDVQGYDMQNLLYNWLEKVLLLILIDNAVAADFDVKITNNPNTLTLFGTARGERINLEKHDFKLEVKGITYHDMKITQEEGGVTVRYLVDI
jgi:SHS2 domain-containing protein